MEQQAVYIWRGGARPPRQLRSKSRILDLPADDRLDLTSFPHWSCGGSSTYPADGSDSHLYLRPVMYAVDPVRGSGNYLVFCDVYEADGRPHASRSSVCEGPPEPRRRRQ